MRSANSFILKLSAAAVLLFAAPLFSEDAIDGPDSVAPGKSAVFRVPKSIAGKEFSWDVLPKDNDLNYLKVTEVDAEAIILLDNEKPRFISFVSFDGKLHLNRILQIAGKTPPPDDNGGGGDDPNDDPPVTVAKNIYVIVLTDGNTPDAKKQIAKDPTLKKFLADSGHKIGVYDVNSRQLAGYEGAIAEYQKNRGEFPAVMLQDINNRNVMTTQPLPASAVDLQNLVKKHTRK